jgi:hypothetical protein
VGVSFRWAGCLAVSTPLSFNVVVEENAATVVTVPPSPTPLTVVPAQPFTVVTVEGPPGPRGQPRHLVIPAPGPTPAFDTDNWDIIDFAQIGTAITSMSASMTGTPQHGDSIILRFMDNGFACLITWGPRFISSGVATLLGTTVPGKQMTVGLLYDALRSPPVWLCMAVDANGY